MNRSAAQGNQQANQGRGPADGRQTSPSCRSYCAGRRRKGRRNERPLIHDLRAMSASASTADISLHRTICRFGREQTSSPRFKIRERLPIETDSSHCVGTPNSKPHLMVARRTIVDADMCVGSFRQSCGVHIFPAPTHGQFSEAGHQ